MSFIDELKRRKVFRVAFTYGVVAWILMQIGEVTFPALNIPDWVMSAVVLVLILGFPVAIIFAWIFDKTPKGYIKTESSMETEGSGVSLDNRPFYLNKQNIFLAVAATIGLFIGMYGSSGISVSEDDRSIAVLPFDNFSSDEEDQFFSDGITEDIIAQLAKNQELSVISRTSVMRYKGSNRGLKEIAEELGVAYILEGSIRKIGERVRIVSQLIDASTDRHLWAETYDESLADIFNIQNKMTADIASVLGVDSNGFEGEGKNVDPTNNIEAYSMYLKGRQYYFKYTKADNERAIQLFKLAVDLDYNYALAWAGLGDSFAQKGIRSGWGNPTYFDSAMVACNRSIELDSTIAEGYKAKGLLYMGKGYPYKALEFTHKAFKKNPGYGSAVANMGIINFGLGQWGRAFWYMEKAQESDPLNPVRAFSTASFLANVGLFHEAELLLTNFQRINPDSPIIIGGLTWLYHRMGEFSKAIEIGEKALKLGFPQANHREAFIMALINSGKIDRAEQVLLSGPSHPFWQGYLDYVRGNNSKARATFDKLSKGLRSSLRYRIPSTPHYTRARIQAVMGETHKALNELELAAATGALTTSLIKVDLVFDSLRDEERFKNVIDILDTKARIERSEMDLSVLNRMLKSKQNL